METSDDFLAHYGVKGMKWGRRSAGAGGGEAKAARKAGRAEIRQNFKNQNKKTNADGSKGKVSAGKTVGSFLLSTNTFGASTGVQIARASGYPKGKSLAIGLLTGPAGALVAGELKVRKNAR